MHSNETCKGYADRDILMPRKINYKAEYMNFNPKLKIIGHRNIPYTKNNGLMEDYHV